MRGSYCTSNWFYGLIAVFYQSRHLKDVKQLHLSHPPASLNPSATVCQLFEVAYFCQKFG